jgi:hypothetical protein
MVIAALVWLTVLLDLAVLGRRAFQYYRKSEDHAYMVSAFRTIVQGIRPIFKFNQSARPRFIQGCQTYFQAWRVESTGLDTMSLLARLLTA